MVNRLISSLGVNNWHEERLPILPGKLFVITGGNSGIGLEAARMLGERGADLILACRSMAKAEDAQRELEKTVTGNVDLVQLDLSNIASIREAADAVRAMVRSIDGLINNAGIMQTPQMLTADGFELQFDTNHLGHFLWTSLLLDLVEAAKGHGRVVQVSSIAHKTGQIQFDDPMFKAGYNSVKAYGQSKLANLMFALELDRRLEAAGSSAIAIACHPGYSATNLQSTGPRGLLNWFYKVTNMLLAQSQRQGAVPTVLAAAGAEAKRGAYYGPTGFYDMNGAVSDSFVAPQALNEEHWRRLWEMSEELLGIEFKIGA